MTYTNNSNPFDKLLWGIGIVALLVLLIDMGREILWYCVLGLLWAFMILLPITGIILLILVFTDRTNMGKAKKILLILASAILIFMGPFNHTLVRSPINVFNPYGIAKVERIPGQKSKSVFTPYRHSAFDKAIIEGLELEKKGIKIYAWTQHLTVEQVLNGERYRNETISSIRNDIYRMNMK